VVQATSQSVFGVGLYTTVEAARLIRARPQAVARWIHGDRQGEAVINAERMGDADRTVTFLDLMQALAIRQVRRQHPEVPLGRIRDAVKEAQEQYRMVAPLAHREHRLFVFDRTLVIRIGEDTVGLAGADRRQGLMTRIVEPFLSAIRHDEASGLANEWIPDSSHGFEVVLRPQFRFGQPHLRPSNILTSELASAAIAEGSVDAAASAFDLPPEAIRLAWRFEDSLTELAA
jgi:uncharacterized protein (DUF433 family)